MRNYFSHNAKATAFDMVDMPATAAEPKPKPPIVRELTADIERLEFWHEFIRIADTADVPCLAAHAAIYASAEYNERA